MEVILFADFSSYFHPIIAKWKDIENDQDAERFLKIEKQRLKKLLRSEAKKHELKINKLNVHFKDRQARLIIEWDEKTNYGEWLRSVKEKTYRLADDFFKININAYTNLCL